jgi:UDP-3-O-[3-hydroxymyristoyl] glucosamine N-acyltransferase
MILPFFYSDMQLKLSDVVHITGGTVLRDAAFENLGMFRNYGRRMLTVYYNANFREQFDENLANFAAVITTAELADTISGSLGVLVSDEPMAAFLKLHNWLCTEQPDFYAHTPPTHIESGAKVHVSAVIAERGVVIEAGAVIEPNAIIQEHTYIGSGTYIGAGVAIGGPGFEMRRINGALTYVPHAGGVYIGANVHVMANSAIAKSVFGGATILGDNTKLDQLVHVAHAVVIGQNCRLAATACISGATTLGDDVWIGPGAVVGNSLRLGDGAWVAMGSAVARDVPAGRRVAGTFARPMMV